MHSRTITFARKAFVLIHPSHFLSNISLDFITMSKKVCSSSSFEKVLESPFSIKDMYSSSHVHGVCHFKKAKGKSSVKVKTTSSTTGKKLKIRKRRSNCRLPASTTLSQKSSVSSITIPNHVRDTPTSLARIDSPDLSHSSRTKEGSSRSILQSFKSSTTPTTSLSTLGKSNKFLSKTSSSISVKSRNTNSTVDVRPSHNYSSLLTGRHNPTRSISRNPFYFRRQGVSTNGYNQFGIHDLARGLRMSKFKKIVIMSGAGISTASGIPDFRTPGTGLYDNLQQYKIPEPSAIFDITFFVRNPRPFFTLAKELFPGKYPPNIAHHFIRLLQEKDLLLRHYTQNIDGLERLAGIKSGKLVEAHGSFATASCTLCHSKHDPVKTKELIFQNKIPYCKHKLCKGIVKPDIVFFGEDLPHKFYALRYADLSQCDLLIVMGTSLEVEPFASLVNSTRYDVPRVLVNREIVGPFKQQRKRSNDVTLTGDMSDRITEIAKLSGWTDGLNELTTKGTEGSITLENKEVVTCAVSSDSMETIEMDRDNQSSTKSTTPIGNGRGKSLLIEKRDRFVTRANYKNMTNTRTVTKDISVESSTIVIDSSSSASNSTSSESDDTQSTQSDTSASDIIVRDISELSITDKKR